MRNWRVVRVQPDGKLYIAEQEYWTKSGAQGAATNMNTTFGTFEMLANAMLGHNYWATSLDKIPGIEEALRVAAQERKEHEESNGRRAGAVPDAGGVRDRQREGH